MAPRAHEHPVNRERVAAARASLLSVADAGRLAPRDLESFGMDVAERAAQEVLALQRHGDDLGGLLDGTDRPGGTGDVIGQQQQPTGAQHPVHLADGPPVVWDGAEPHLLVVGRRGLVPVATPPVAVLLFAGDRLGLSRLPGSHGLVARRARAFPGWHARTALGSHDYCRAVVAGHACSPAIQVPVT
jgi:hypothetical protein